MNGYPEIEEEIWASILGADIVRIDRDTTLQKRKS